MPRVAANGMELEHESFGTGEPVVLIMGIGAQMTWWRTDFCRLLADQGFQVIRFDNRDIGLSTWLDEELMLPLRVLLGKALLGLRVEAPYTLADMADDTVALVQALGLEQAHVVGCSMGGMIAQLAAIRHPQRVLSLTSIMSTTGERRFLGRPDALRALVGSAPRSRDEVADKTLDLFRVIGSPGYPLDEAELREAAEQAFDRSFHPRGFARQLAAILASGHRRKELERLQVPALVLHGEADPLVPVSAGRATARAIPGARLRTFEGMGHDLPRALWPQIAAEISRHARAASALSASRRTA